VCEINHLRDVASGQVEIRTLAKKAFIAKAFHLIFDDITALGASVMK